MSEKNYELQLEEQVTTEKLVTFQNFREKKLKERRTEYGRILFTESLGIETYMEIGSSKIVKKINLIDLSVDGISFYLSHQDKDFEIELNEPIIIRFYFLPTAYVPIVCQLKNSAISFAKHNPLKRYGAQIENKTQGQNVVKKLLEFIQLSTESSIQDHARTKFG